MLTIEEIQRFIDEDRTSEKKMFARKGQAYYDGDHDIKAVPAVLLQCRWRIG